MASVWSVPTTWTGLAVKSTVAMPPTTVALTVVLPPVRKLWSPNLDSASVGPVEQAAEDLAQAGRYGHLAG